MKKFSDLISPVSWLVMFVTLMTTLVTVFKPSIAELAVFFIVDSIVVVPVQALELVLFCRLYPQYVPLLVNFENNSKPVRLLPVDINLYSIRRTTSRLIWGIFKIIPAFLVVWLYWEGSQSSYVRLFKFFVFEGMFHAWFFGVMYLESLLLIQNFLDKSQLAYSRNSYIEQQRDTQKYPHIEPYVLVVLSVWVFILLGVIIYENTNYNIKSYYSIAMVLFGYIAMTYRFIHVHSCVYLGGVKSIVNQVLDDKFLEIGLTPHGAPLLSDLSHVVDSLASRIRAREAELNHWVNQEIDKSRFKALGEVAGLVAHDLSGPLHVISYCSDELQESMGPGRDRDLCNRIVLNADHAVHMVNGLKAHVRGVSDEEYSYVEASYTYVVQLLKTQLVQAGAAAADVQFSLDPALIGASVPMTRFDSIHLLYNLMKNSMDSVLRNKATIKEATMGIVELRAAASGASGLVVVDNGEGVNLQQYNAMINDESTVVGMNHKAGHGVGLRLIKSLLNRYSFSITAITAVKPMKTAIYVSMPIKLNRTSVVPKNTTLVSRSEGPRPQLGL